MTQSATTTCQKILERDSKVRDNLVCVCVRVRVDRARIRKITSTCVYLCAAVRNHEASVHTSELTRTEENTKLRKWRC